MTTTRQAKICIETLLLRRRICGPPGLLAPQEGPSPFEVDDGQSAISRARVLFSLSVRWLINFHPGSGGWAVATRRRRRMLDAEHGSFGVWRY